ncbi:MAG: arsenate reductase family protein [Deltaproteobacteria bacterium]|nr:arsenate reductase family protein [Deltaproteobacteria bacterium]
MITVYHYPNCSTCKRALKWLNAHDLEYQKVHIVDAPPSQELLKSLWQRSGKPLKAMFNTSGQSYRNGGFKDKLPSMSEDEQLAALAADGKLIKRPLVDNDGKSCLIGFKEPEWDALL